MNRNRRRVPSAVLGIIGVTVAVIVVTAVVLSHLAAPPLDGTWSPTPVDTWSVSPSDDAELIVAVSGGGRPNDVRVDIVEQDTDAVRVQGWVLVPNGLTSSVGVRTLVTLHLNAPLGNRPVKYQDGSLVPRSS